MQDNPSKQCLSAQRGSTFIELTIVLLIVAFIVIAFIFSQTILSSAKEKSVLKDIYTIASSQQIFRDKYHGMPGNYSRASTMFNGVSGSGSGFVSGAELPQYFVHLTAAGILNSKIEANNENCMDATGGDGICYKEESQATLHGNVYNLDYVLVAKYNYGNTTPHQALYGKEAEKLDRDLGGDGLTDYTDTPPWKPDVVFASDDAVQIMSNNMIRSVTPEAYASGGDGGAGGGLGSFSTIWQYSASSGIPESTWVPNLTYISGVDINWINKSVDGGTSETGGTGGGGGGVGGSGGTGGAIGCQSPPTCTSNSQCCNNNCAIGSGIGTCSDSFCFVAGYANGYFISHNPPVPPTSPCSYPQGGNNTLGIVKCDNQNMNYWCCSSPIGGSGGSSGGLGGTSGNPGGSGGSSGGSGGSSGDTGGCGGSSGGAQDCPGDT